MIRTHLSRRALLLSSAGGVIGGGLGLGAAVPWRSPDAEAQVDPSHSGTNLPPDQYDPALTGMDPTLGGMDPAIAGIDPALAAPESGLVAPATPVVTPEPLPPAPTWEPTDAGMTTSLGGSDVAVASVGESHQVDAPKRKANKILGEKKRP